MSWIQIRAHISADQVELVEDSLLALGSLAVTLQDDADQPILEPELGTMPVWDKTQIVGLFPASQDSDELLLGLQQMMQAANKSLPQCKVEIVEDKDWERAWMDNFHPMQFGDRLWVCPSWREPEDASAVNLMLDPGLAFGTGTHPTTSLCLQWLDKNVDGSELILDYGCGSGILGIAGLLLGSDKMIGVDNDQQAIIATQQNAERNEITEDQYQVYLPENTPSFESDITVANILAGPLMTLAESIAALTKTGGKLALSGILAEQAQQVSDIYQQWFDMEPAVQLEDWVLLQGTKR